MLCSSLNVYSKYSKQPLIRTCVLRTFWKKFATFIPNYKNLFSLACVAAGPRICLNHLYSPFANLSAKKLVLISCRVKKTYVNVSDRQVSYRFLMHLTIRLILMCAWQLGAVICQNLEKGVGKQWTSRSNLKAFFCTNECFEGFIRICL